ncbi:MAG: hypothetical protein AAB699_01725 [Patescibacteria group bacterium]
MSDVEFSEEEAERQAFSRLASRGASSGGSGLVKAVIRFGFAQDESGATGVLAGVALLAAVLAFVIFAWASSA